MLLAGSFPFKTQKDSKKDKEIANDTKETEHKEIATDTQETEHKETATGTKEKLKIKKH